MNHRLLVIFALFCFTLSVAAGPPQPVGPTEYRVLWSHTLSYPTNDYAKAKASYEGDKHRAKYGWATGITNQLQRKVGGVWIDLERHQQPYETEGAADAPPPKY